MGAGWKEWEIGGLCGFIWGAFSTLLCISRLYATPIHEVALAYKVALAPVYLSSLILNPPGCYCSRLTPLLLFPFLIGTIIGISVGVMVKRIRMRGRK